MRDRRFEPGNEYSVNYYGEKHTIVIVQDYGNGTFEVLIDGEGHAMAKPQLEEWITNPVTADVYAILTGETKSL